MKTTTITIEGVSVEDGSLLAAALGNLIRKLHVNPSFNGANLTTIGALIADEWSLGNELGKLVKADENGIAGLAVVINVKLPEPLAAPVPTALAVPPTDEQA